MQRKSVVGTRSSLLWLLILIGLILLAGLVMVGLVILPQLQASRAEQAYRAEAERHYQAGIAFQNVEDWTAAEGEFRQVISLDASYRDVQDRLAAVRARLKEVAATATAAAEAEAVRARANATATAQAAPTATQQALEAHYQKGIAYINLERWYEAQTELEEVLRYDPNYKDVQTKLKQVAIEISHIAPTQTPIATPTPTQTPIIAKPPTPTVSLTIVELNVQAKDGWQSSGLNLKVGQEVKIAASGRWNHGPESGEKPYYGPEGYSRVDTSALLPSAPVGKLIGRIGGGAPFAVGAGVSFTVSSAGGLDFSMNDVPGFFEDNDGFVTIRISVR